ncbi:hypothetical protein OROGR_015419 [Orobanche gracilis]
MPLKSITAAWENGELADCNLTSSEWWKISLEQSSQIHH